MVFSIPEQFHASRRALTASAAVLALVAAGHAQAQEDPEAQALSATGVAGEILDTAIAHCRRGEHAQAMAMLQAIRAQLDPPPGILRVVQDLEATGCVRQELATSGRAFRLQLGSGWDSNVSQGVTARSLVLGSGETALELELDESYRPRSSAFAQAALDYTTVLPGSAVTVQTGAGVRKNARQSSFDIGTLSASASREFKVAGDPLRVQLDAAEVWLGNRHYQRTQGAGLQWLKASQDGAWLATLSGNRIQYLTQPSQNAVQFEVGLLREQRIHAAASVHAGVSLQRDNAGSDRPGGDRAGFQVQAGALVLAQGWRFKPQISYTSFDSDEVFAAGLLDVQRRNRVTQAALQAEKPMSPQTSLIVEWRGRWARDTVALYRYTAQTVTATLSHRF